MEKAKKDIARRDVLKWAGLGVAALAATKVSDRSAAVAAVLKGKRYAMVIDLRRCYGCHTCSIACKAEFDVPLGKWRSWVKYVERGKYPDVKRHYLPRVCNQCSKPPCVKVCPTRASHVRSDGIVDIDEKLCIACKNCIAMCPYDSRFTHPDEKVAQKCDFCKHRIEKGVQPSCVNACPANARIFGDLNDPNSKVSKLLSLTPVQTLKPELGTEPNVFYIAGDGQTMRIFGGGDYK